MNSFLYHYFTILKKNSFSYSEYIKEKVIIKNCFNTIKTALKGREPNHMNDSIVTQHLTYISNRNNKKAINLNLENEIKSTV